MRRGGKGRGGGKRWGRFRWGRVFSTWPAASSARRFEKMLLFDRPSSSLSVSIDCGPSDKYSAATICPPSRVIPGKLATTSAPTPSSSVRRVARTGSSLAFSVIASHYNRAMPNRLASEASPYLRQHAENPVDWYPWGD